MTNLIQNFPRSSTIPNLHAEPKHNIYNRYQTPPQPSLSPEAKSTLWTGLMCGVLGGIWAAPPKYNAAELIELKQDVFDKLTKSSPEAFSPFSQIKNIFNNTIEDNFNYFFGDKNEILKQDLLRQLNEKSEETLTKSIEKMEPSIQKIKSLNLNEAFGQISDFNKLTKEQLEAIKALLGDELFQEISNKKPTNINEFLTSKINLYERKNFGLLLCNTSTDEQIFKAHAKEIANKELLASFSEAIKDAYSQILSKLPKKRLKTAAKWFGMGLGFSMLMNIIFGAIKNRKTQK